MNSLDVLKRRELFRGSVWSHHGGFMKYHPVFLALCLAGCTQGLAEEDSEKLRAMMMTVEALPLSYQPRC